MNEQNQLPEDAASAVLDNYFSCEHTHRWVYKEVMVVKHVPELIRELRTLRSSNEELRAEVARLSLIAKY